MHEKDWTCLSTIFDEKNLTRAAEILYISQPALTYRIRELEKELDIKIFIKGKGTVKFTTEGYLLVKYAKKMLVELNKLKGDLHKTDQPGNGILNITAGETFSHTELPDILSKFQQLYLNIKFNITSINPNNILDKLVNAESHVVLIRSKLDWNGPHLLLRKDPVCIISKEPIFLKDLPKYPRINFLLTLSTKRAVEEWWQEHFSVPPLIGMIVCKPEACHEMIRKNLGYAIGPLYPSQIISLQNGLQVMPLQRKDGTPFELNFYAYYREEVAQIKRVQTFIKFLKQYYSA